MTNQLDLKAFQIYLPDGDRKSFLIYGDLRELLGVKHQVDAIKKIRNSIKDLGLKPQPAFNYQEHFCGIQTKNPDTLFIILQNLKRLAVSESLFIFSEEEMNDLHVKLVDWKSPKPQKWKIGDIFSLKLHDNSYAFGQIIGKHPTVALFNYKKHVNQISSSELIDKQIVTVLHVTSNSLNNWSWEIKDNLEPLVNKDSGPTSSDSYQIGQRSFSDNVLTSVANYYWFKICKWPNENDLKDLILIK